MARLSQFKHQIQFFTDKGFTVVAYDYFGMGRSHKPRHADYSTHSHMEDLKALYRRYRSAVAPNFVAGHSFGSAQTLRLASSAATDTSLHPSPAGIMLLGGGKLDPEKRTKALQLFKLPVWALRVLHPMLSKGFKSRALHPNTLTSQESHHVELMTVAAAANGANPFHVTAPFYRSVRRCRQTSRFLALPCVHYVGVRFLRPLQSTPFPHSLSLSLSLSLEQPLRPWLRTRGRFNQRRLDVCSFLEKQTRFCRLLLPRRCGTTPCPTPTCTWCRWRPTRSCKKHPEK